MHACAVCAQSKRKEANEFYKNELKKKERLVKENYTRHRLDVASILSGDYLNIIYTHPTHDRAHSAYTHRATTRATYTHFYEILFNEKIN